MVRYVLQEDKVYESEGDMMGYMIFNKPLEIQNVVWRHAIRKRLPSWAKCTESLDIRKKLFDHDTELAVMVGMSMITGETDDRFPVDWIEALKDRWLPGWARKRWPVRYIHIRVVFPEYKEGDVLPRAFFQKRIDK